MTKSYAMALDLKDDAALIERYIEHHRAVWPEALDSLKRLGIEKMKIFLLGRRLFMYVEVPDDFDFPGGLWRDTPKSLALASGTSSCAASRRKSPARCLTSGGPRWSRCGTCTTGRGNE